MTANYPLTLLYDAGCPVCSLEMDHLRERNHAGALRFVDIAAPGFDPAPYGVTLAALNAEIHGVRPDGSLIRGVPVLRLAYTAAGLGWVVRPTGWAPLQPMFDALYCVFARNRQPISRVAAPLIDAVRAQRARRAVARMSECSAGEGAACQRHHAHVPTAGRHTTGSTS
jgi:predicted DCC family thiol-disulfide oxidoreductase YuxK